jgi:RecJ-like exonuclease
MSTVSENVHRAKDWQARDDVLNAAGLGDSIECMVCEGEGEVDGLQCSNCDGWGVVPS